MSAPVIFALREFNDDQKSLWLTHFGKGNIEPELLERSLQLIHSTNALSQCRTLAEDHIAKAKDALSSLPHSAMKSVLLNLADYVLTRDA